jgi:exopolysaccharide biosynthesis polyprenyl glycosylphosphotransferase
MLIRIILFLANMILINVAFLLSFLVRYGLPFPEFNFSAYKKIAVFLTLIYTSTLLLFRVYKSRFKSSWDLFRRIFSGLFIGTLLSTTLVYIFRQSWGAFPTSVFVIFFFISLLLIFLFNQRMLKVTKKIKKKVLIIGEGQVDEIVTKNADVERRKTEDMMELTECRNIDEIFICDDIQHEKNLNFLIYLVQKLKIDVIFSPSNYMKLLSERINGEDSYQFLNTFFGKKTNAEEFLIRSLDIIGSLVILFICGPAICLVTFLVMITSPGSIFYKQQRVGKHGKIFTLYKFRTMIKDAERRIGPVLASQDDPRVTRVGRILRKTRVDELPQLFNVLRGDMSLVGPRPERPHFVKIHKALRELRLAIRPGMTGLAQVRGFYDLKPQHKIKYDYLYIQRRSFLLNLYIIAMTIPVVLSGKGR